MQENIQAVVFVIIGTILLLFLVSFIILSLYFYQKGQHKNMQELSGLKHAYTQEILKAQLEVKEQTLHSISQEIHDNIGQVLSLVKLNLNTFFADDTSVATTKVNAIKELVGKAIQDLRNLSKSLNSDYIVTQTLPEILKLELDNIEKTGLIATKLNICGTEQFLDSQKTLITSRIAQEALNNILKHSNAKAVEVALIYSDTSFTLIIEDDGKGFLLSDVNNSEKDRGTGIGNMKHRARLIKAEFNIITECSVGTIIKLSLPLTS